jgi:hypothetical protein
MDEEKREIYEEREKETEEGRREREGGGRIGTYRKSGEKRVRERESWNIFECLSQTLLIAK